jgi:hypothetical protein
MDPAEMTRITVTWQLAGVILAIFFGVPCFVLIAVLISSNDRTPSLVYAILAVVGGSFLTWGILGIRSQYNALSDDAERKSFMKRILVGSAMVGLCIIGVGIGDLTHEYIVPSIGAALGVYGVVMVGKAMTQTSESE